jgi:hypothetical protein
MKLEVIKNKEPDLPLCEMNCDNGIAEHLNNFELTKFFNGHTVNLFCGRSGSGKTSLLYSFFKASGKNNRVFKKVFHNIFLFQPRNSRGSMKDNIFDKELPENKKYDDLDYDSLSEVIERCKEEDPKYNNCIIIDDFGAKLKNPELKELFKELVFNRRHLRVSLYFLNQTYISLEKDIRKLFSNVVLFKTAKSEFEKVMEELLEQKKDIIPELMRLVYDKKHSWLLINVDSQRTFKKFDEIIIKEEE